MQSEILKIPTLENSFLLAYQQLAVLAMVAAVAVPVVLAVDHIAPTYLEVTIEVTAVTAATAVVAVAAVPVVLEVTAVVPHSDYTYITHL